MSLPLLLSPLSFAQEARKVESQAAPVYPMLAKRMHVAGVVTVAATVLPNGKVETAKAVSGHPLLALAAEDAVLRMRFIPAATESDVDVKVRFTLDDR